jgi:hypothetical protein
MINKKEILVGTKDELVEYVNNLVNPSQLDLSGKGNVLYTKEGFASQIDDIIKLYKNKMGSIYYLLRKDKGEFGSPDIEVNLTLCSVYVCIKENEI